MHDGHFFRGLTRHGRAALEGRQELRAGLRTAASSATDDHRLYPTVDAIFGALNGLRACLQARHSHHIGSLPDTATGIRLLLFFAQVTG